MGYTIREKEAKKRGREGSLKNKKRTLAWEKRTPH